MNLNKMDNGQYVLNLKISVLQLPFILAQVLKILHKTVHDQIPFILNKYKHFYIFSHHFKWIV